MTVAEFYQKIDSSGIPVATPEAKTLLKDILTKNATPREVYFLDHNTLKTVKKAVVNVFQLFSDVSLLYYTVEGIFAKEIPYYCVALPLKTGELVTIDGPRDTPVIPDRGLWGKQLTAEDAMSPYQRKMYGEKLKYTELAAEGVRLLEEARANFNKTR